AAFDVEAHAVDGRESSESFCQLVDFNSSSHAMVFDSSNTDVAIAAFQCSSTSALLRFRYDHVGCHARMKVARTVIQANANRKHLVGSLFPCLNVTRGELASAGH